MSLKSGILYFFFSVVFVVTIKEIYQVSMFDIG